MPLEPIEQVITAFKQKKHLLITAPAHPSGDGVSAALALSILARRFGKRATISIDGGTSGLNGVYDFLPEYHSILSEVKQSGETELEFGLDNQAVTGLTYSVKNNALRIRVFSEAGTLHLSAPTIKKAAYPYDLIVVLDSADLESLGRVYEEHTEFFYHTPIINIDHKPDNEHFGELNLVEMTAVSTTEIIYNIINKWDKSMLDEQMSTCLLAGIILKSKSFQRSNITPQTLAVASELITNGARREQIVERLFNNKPVNILQVWGRALANLRTDPNTGIVWSIVNKKDFVDTQTTERELFGVVEDMLTHSLQAKVVMVVYPRENAWHAIVHTHLHALDLRKILSPIQARGARSMVEVDIEMRNGDNAALYVREMIIERWPREAPMPKF